MSKTGIHWFRNDLRIHDNPALISCLDQVERFIPIFIFDGKTSGTDICGFVRFRFLIQSLKDLEDKFKEVGINFMCFYGEPHEIFEKLFKDYDVKVLSFQKDTEAIWRKRDKLITEMCEKKDIQIIEKVSHTLYDPDVICSLNFGSPPNTYEELKQLCLKIGEPDEPVLTPDLKFYSSNFIQTNDIYDENLHKVQNIDYFDIRPECKEQEVVKFIGGETKALDLYQRRYNQEKDSFKKGLVGQNIAKPIFFYKEVSLSPYFRFGCLSARKFYFEITKLFMKYFKGDKGSFKPAEPLLWREYFYHLSYKNDKFDQICGNIMSFKIPWDWGGDHLYKKWELGKTGFPWIDASMRQLRQEGWIHHICRTSVSVFLTRGQFFLSWTKGHQTFLRLLVDGDWCINAGNWNWISSGDPEEIETSSSCICPIRNGKKVDPNGAYIKKYVPELENYPIEYLFEPWKAPLELQIEFKCIIGKDYPEPCIDHEQSFLENVKKLKQYFESEKKNVYEVFLEEKNAIKPSNKLEYNLYTFSNYFKNEFENF